jgi:hypothetical protein
MFIGSTSSQGAYGTVGSGGEIMVRARTLIVWDVAVPTTKSIPISQTIGVTDVCILLGVVKGTPEFAYPAEKIAAYCEAGFGVFIVIGMNGILLKPEDCDVLLNSPNIKGFGVDGANLDAFPADQKEQCLIDLALSCKAEGKEFFYYYGDGLNPDVHKMAATGAILQCQWRAQMVRFQEVHPFWAQLCIWRNRPDHPANTTKEDIVNWYANLPVKPEALLFWQTTDHNDPSSDQIEGMRIIVQNFGKDVLANARARARMVFIRAFMI